MHVDTFDKTASPLRWAVLVLACLSMFGSYYVYDNPTALQNQFQSSNYTGSLDLSDLQYSLLYSVYSFPNTVLPFFGGVFVDLWGTNTTMVVFLTLICIGQAVFAVGVTLKKFWLALVGRLIFGFGGESLSVAQSTLLAGWFRGKEIAFAMGINLSISRVGSVVNDNVSPAAYKAWSLAAAIWVGFFICCVSLCATITLVCIDRYARVKTKEIEERQKLLDPTADLTIQANTAEENKPKVPAYEAFKKVVVDIVHDVVTFSASYWLLLFSCLVVYASILPFNNIASREISLKYGYDSTTSDYYLMIPFLISAVCSPFLGGVVDLFGRRAVLLTMSASFLVLAHLLLGYAMPPAWLPMVIIGLSYSVYAAAMWPSVSYVVEQRTLGRQRNCRTRCFQ